MVAQQRTTLVFWKGGDATVVHTLDMTSKAERVCSGQCFPSRPAAMISWSLVNEHTYTSSTPGKRAERKQRQQEQPNACLPAYCTHTHPFDQRPRRRVHGDVLPHFEDVITEVLVVDGIGAVLVVAVEQTLQLSLRRTNAYLCTWWLIARAE